MTNDKNHIPYPAGDDKEKSIQLIVAGGMPEKQRLSAALPKIYRFLGFRGLFFGVGECVFLAVLASVLLWLCLLSTIHDNTTFLYAIFVASPFLYAALHLLTTWKEIMSGTFEYMMSCRCSLRQLTVLRMLVFGGVCVLVSVIVSAILGRITAGSISVFQGMGVSFSALFLFAAIQMVADWKWNTPICHVIAPIFWVLLSTTLFFVETRSPDFILKIPAFVFWIISIASLSVYAVVIHKYYFKPKEGVHTYAFG